MNSKISSLLFIFCFLHCLTINSMQKNNKNQNKKTSNINLHYPWVQEKNRVWEFDRNSPLRYISNNDEHSKRLDTIIVNNQKKSQLNNLSKK